MKCNNFNEADAGCEQTLDDTNFTPYNQNRL